MLFPCARHVILYLVLIQPRKRPDMTENFLTCMGGSRGGDRPPPLNDHKNMFSLQYWSRSPENRKDTRPEFNTRPTSVSLAGR